MKNPFLYLLIPIALLFFFSCEKTEDSPAHSTQIDSPEALAERLERILEETEVPGFAISIVKNDAIAFRQTFGYADVEAQKPYTNQTVQHLASVSKTFVGAAAAKAIEQGLFSMDTDINDILPIPLHNPKQPNEVIRVRHLLTHTSGLLDNVPVYLATNYYILPGEDLSTPAAQLMINEIGISTGMGDDLGDFLANYFLEGGEWYSPDNFADTAPGTSWAYCNMSTGLMAYLIEVAAQQPFHEYVKTQILQALGMDHSTYQIDEVDRNALCKWYLDKDTPFPLYASHSYAEGGVFTSNEDLSKYLLDMVKGRQGTSEVLFSTSAYEQLFANQLANGIVPADFAENHGLYWIKEGTKIRHGGNSLGVSTYIELDASQNAGYSLMTNLDASINSTAFQKVGQLIDEAVQQFIQSN